jgi:hypothetical protein
VDIASSSGTEDLGFNLVKVSRENMAMLLCLTGLLCMCVLKREIKALAKNIFVIKKTVFRETNRMEHSASAAG